MGASIKKENYVQLVKRLTIIALLFILPLTYIEKLVEKKVLNDFETYYASCKQDKKSILLVWGHGTGEQEQTFRFKIAAQRIGVDLKVVSSKPKKLLISHYIHNTALQAARIMQPNLILIIERGINHIPNAANFLVLDQSSGAYLARSRQEVELAKYDLLKFSGLLVTFPEISLLRKAFYKNDCRLFGMQWYPTVYKTTYKAQAPKKLFYPGGVLRDNTRGSKKYKDMFSKLDNYGYLQVAGKKDKWQHTPRSILEPIPFDGVSLLATQNKAGISLILHDIEHLEGNVPSSRIFEAAAANTVIITDKLKFIEKHFGDNVLYIDVSKTSAEIASQIDSHVRWIHAHQDLAKLMAERCHEIFLEKFTLEKQLVKLLYLNERIAEYNLSSKLT